MHDFHKVTVPPDEMRRAYLDGLVEPQELFLEQLVAAGETWLCDDTAYAVVADDQLVEFHVLDKRAADDLALLNAAMDASGASSILCKSFDQRLLDAALSQEADVSTVGMLFRRVADPTFVARDGLAFRAANAADVKTISNLDDAFFDDVDEIQRYADAGGLFPLLALDEIVGCGISMPVIPGEGNIDIGMWVAPARRGKGYGAYVASYMKHRVLGWNMRPICGCGVDNVASYRALTSAGFASDHRILQITPRVSREAFEAA